MAQCLLAVFLAGTVWSQVVIRQPKDNDPGLLRVQALILWYDLESSAEVILTKWASTIGEVCVAELVKENIATAASTEICRVDSRLRGTPGVSNHTVRSIVVEESASPSVEYIEGQPYQTLTAEGVRISLTFGEDRRANFAGVAIVNGSDHEITVLPQYAELRITVPKATVLLSKDPARIARSIDRRQRWASAIDQLAAAFQRETITMQTQSQGTFTLHSLNRPVYGTYQGNVTETTSAPDWEARRAAAIRTMQRQNSANEEIERILSTSLRPHTIHPGESIAGLVWFNKESAVKKKGTKFTVRIPTDRRMFEFRYDGSPSVATNWR